MTVALNKSSNGGTFCGVSLGNFTRSGADAFTETEQVGSASYPRNHTHGLTFARTGVHVIPFFVLSDLLYKSYLSSGALSTFNIDQRTLFPVTGATNYVLSSSISGNSNISGDLVNIDSLVSVSIPRNSEGGVIVDVGDLSKFADSIYDNQTSAGRDVNLPGSSLTYYAPSVIGQVNSTKIATPEDPLKKGDFTTSANIRDLVQRPRVYVSNQSTSPAYVGESNGRKFEGVSHQMGVRPFENILIEYNPATLGWTVVNANARA